MVHVSLARGWDLEVERGPDWLFVRPQLAEGDSNAPDLAEQVWGVLEQGFKHRLVLELDCVRQLDSHLIAQLLRLCKRIAASGGIMRICGLSAKNEEVLHVCGLEGRLPIYRDREDAVMGNSRPSAPR